MKTRNISFFILIADLLWILGALGFAIAVRYVDEPAHIGFAVRFQMYLLMALVAGLTWTFLYFEMGLDGFKGGWNLPAILSKLIVAVSLLMAFVLAFAFAAQRLYSRLVLLFFALFFPLGLVILRCLWRALVTSRFRNGADLRCVILGNGPVAQELASRISAHPELPFQVVGFLLPAEADISNGFGSALGGPPLSSIKSLQVSELLVRSKIQKLIVATGQTNNAEIRKLIAECRKVAIQVFVVPQSYDLYLSETELIEIDGLPLLSVREHKSPASSLVLKRVLDTVLSIGILVLVWPLLGLASLFVFTKKGKAFRTELRSGKDGVPFGMYRLNIDRFSASPQTYERLFVRWSLTELPQLWNVLRGDMSLVGPRPESPERVKHYSEWQRQRLKVNAGVTGLAQVHGLREQHPSEDKTRFDMQYIFDWSPLLDLSLILQTIWTLLSRGLIQTQITPQMASPSRRGIDLVTQEVENAHRP